MTARNAFCFCLFLFNCCLQTVGQSAAGFHITHYDETDGLGNNKITAMLQDSRGYLWFGTANGLYRYDGYTFKAFRKVTGDQNSISGNVVTKLAEDRDGKIWIGLARTGISCYDPASGYFKNYPLQLADSQLAVATAVTMLFIDQENAVWAGMMQKGVIRLDRNTSQFQQYNIIADTSTLYSKEFRPTYNSAYAMHEEKKGVYWLATHDGLYRFVPGQGIMSAVRAKTPDNTGLRDDLFGALLADSNGLWLGSWAGGLSYYDLRTGQWSNYKFSKRNKNIGTTNIIQDIKIRNDQELWIASNDGGLGIFHKNTRRFTFIGDDSLNHSNFPTKLCDRILQDRQHNLWLGHAGGLIRIREREKKFVYNPVKVTRSDNGSYYGISALLEDRLGKYLFIGTSFADGLQVVNKVTGAKQVFPFAVMHGEESALIVTDMIQDSKGLVWVLTRDYVYQYDLQKGKLILLPQPLPYRKDFPSNNYIAIREDKRGRIWIASERNGLFCYDPASRKYDHFYNDATGKKAIPSNVVRTIAVDGRGRVWLGNRRGCFGYLDDSLKVFVNPDEAIPIDSTPKNHVYALFADREGDIWVGTDAGLYYYKANQAKPVPAKVYNADNGLQEEIISRIQEDAEGYIWCSTPASLCKLNKNTGSIVTYGKLDGLDRMSLSEGLFLFRDSNMALLTNGGYFTFNPLSFPKKNSTVPLVITSFKIDDKEAFCEEQIKGPEPVDVPANANVISFEFAALDFDRPDKQEYAYKLEGFDKDWVMAGGRRYAGYANIPGGDYTFKVKATNVPGNWSTAVISLSVHVRRPFYRTGWFLVMVVVALGASLYLFYRAKLTQQQQILQLETKAQVLEKEKTLVLYENLKQHLNPHFLFNSLTSLSSLIRIDQKMAGNFLDKMSKIYRYILKNRDSEVVALSEELKFVQLYIDLQLTRFGEGLCIHKEIDEEYLHRKIAPVTLQNLVENAIKHNLVDAESPLVIDMYIEQDYLVVRNNLQKKNFVETSNRQGLANMLSLYRFLSKKPMLIQEDAAHFTVMVPLL